MFLRLILQKVGDFRKGGISVDTGASSYRRYLDGDENGFIELVRDYKDGLMLYLNRIVCDIHIAEDLTEDTFVKLGTKKPKYKQEKGSFKKWLYTIGRNVAIDYLRKNSKISEISIENCGQFSAEQENLENLIIKEERKIIVRNALNKLKPEYRQVIWLTYFENFNNKEVADVMKKSVHNIETLLYRARKALKAELEKEGFEYENL